ncbi:MAG TPA: glycosyltransferase family 2 protein [Terracidiphilus sp.]|nr:glycosyltransferase family 2 protein [Terracidiphilus sp.]
MTLPEANAKAPKFEDVPFSPAPIAGAPGKAGCALTIIVPCHNEEQVLPETARRLIETLDPLAARELIADPKLFFVDDGSSDNTWLTIESLAAQDPRIHGLKLSTNFGQQNAILAGLLTAPGDILISIDADLQDDVNAIGEMVEAHSSGAEVVYGIRRDRTTDSYFKRVTAESYYRLLRAMGVKLVFNHADFRLLSRRVVEQLRNCKESNLLLRGLIPQLGFRSASVYYDRQVRFAGKTKYSLSKMLSLAVTGVTSFTEIPLKVITVLGMLVSLFSFGLALWAFAVKLVMKLAIPGWASIVIPIYFLGGIQLLCLGVIGQYLAKVYAETKARPRFIVDKIL